jgi:hypothetical protein
LPIRMTADAGGTLVNDPQGQTDVAHLFVLRVENGRGAYAYAPALKAGQMATDVIPSMETSVPLDRFAEAVADDLARRLVASGLYPKEARAMVNTWKHSYFETDGIRALVIMPQGWTDRFIPITVTPRPKDLVRVMVGRLELLTPERERLAEQSIRDLASPDETRRREAFASLKGQGRYVEPIVRRVLKTTRDDSIRMMCKRLLLADFVTDLRAVVHSVAGSKPLSPEMVWNEEPAYVRAQLAGLLREVGLDTEARTEGAAALAALKAIQPVMNGSCRARQGLRALGRAYEGTGNDRAAAEHYGRLVELGGKAAREADCRKCHQGVGIAADFWLRDWTAGEHYATALARSGGLDTAIADTAKAASRPDAREDVLLKLGYLLAKTGRASEAEAIWTDLGSRLSGAKVAVSVPSGGR